MTAAPKVDTQSDEKNAKKSWNRQKGNGPVTKNQSTKSAFKGAISALNGNVFEVHNKASKANQYQKTTQAIAAYANRTMKYGKDMRYIIENLQEINFASMVPVEPTNATG
mmetsp:Transcript_13632/g.25640  ORF Transcript_13632/g.25640 Transcript_13632/m.25640 type:complete len:110 (-) Transcript_13632:1191-1520(-)